MAFLWDVFFHDSLSLLCLAHKHSSVCFFKISLRIQCVRRCCGHFPFFPCGLRLSLEVGTDLRKSLHNLLLPVKSATPSVYNSYSVSPFYFSSVVQGYEDKMNVITRSCVLFLWMYTLTFVKSQRDCTLENFMNGKLYDSNFDTSDMQSSYPSGKQIRVSCKIGFSGFFKLICAGGNWDHRGTKCQPRSCGHPGDAQFADFHLAKGDDFVFGSQVVYTCHSGYQMVSRTNHRNCMAEGWDGVVPVCEAQQCPVIHVGNNVLVNGDPEEATFGNVVRFSCKSNAEVLVGPVEIYCDETGEWSGKAPECKAIKCFAPHIENGHVTRNIQEYNEHDVLYFQCNQGYTRYEQRPSKCVKQGTRAEWIPAPICELTTCKLDLNTLGTGYSPNQNKFIPGDTVNVTCGNMYWITDHQSTTAESTCRSDGQWTVTPVCKEVTCRNERPPNVYRWGFYWGQIIKLHQNAWYNCERGYERTAERITCTRAGWSPDPFCQEKTCKKTDVLNADIDSPVKPTYKIGERVYYVCKDGYEGNPIRTCHDGYWAGNSQCTEKTCRKTDIFNADIDNPDKQTYKIGEMAKYTCKDGYKGNPIRTCVNGHWDGNSQCTESLCSRPEIDNAVIHGSNQKERYRHNDRVKFVCENNSEMRFAVTCDGGVWTGIQSCSACPKATVRNGFVVGPINDTVYYSCNEGYKLSTKGWWGKATCQDKKWSVFHQCIEKSDCGELPVIPNGKVLREDKNDTAVISCNEGYQAQNDSLTCHEGSWSSDGSPLKTICTPIRSCCGPPPKFDNAVVVTSFKKKYLSDSQVTYQCRDDYTMEGNNKITCIDGEWEMNDISCTPSTLRHRVWKRDADRGPKESQ